MYKFTKQQIQDAVNNTNSMSAAAEYIGISYGAFRRQALHYNLWKPNSSGKGMNKPKRYKEASDVFKDGKCVHSHILHKWLPRFKDVRCSECGITHWRNKIITLEIDHVDGDKLNNRLENLRYLCPNCHSLTETWRGRNKKTS